MIPYHVKRWPILLYMETSSKYHARLDKTPLLKTPVIKKKKSSNRALVNQISLSNAKIVIIQERVGRNIIHNVYLYVNLYKHVIPVKIHGIKTPCNSFRLRRNPKKKANKLYVNFECDF